MIHPIQSFKAMPTQKKAAVVGGAVAATALVATGAAYLAGKGSVSEEVKGLKAVGSAIKAGFEKAKTAVVDFFGGLKEKVTSHKEKAGEVVEQVEEAAQ